MRTFKKIGWIGTGVMGKSMAGHLLKSGHQLSVFTRTASKADSLISNGATFKTAKELAQESDVLFMMLGYPSDVENILYKHDGGILQYMKEGSFLVDHTTSKPALAHQISESCKIRGVHSIDAPVSGGDIGARNGTLVSMCGGEKEAFEHVKPLLEVYSKEAALIGKAGAGQHTKMANQINIAGSMIGVCEGLLYSYRAGIDAEKVFQIIKGGSAGSFSLTSYAPRIMAGDMEPGFYVEHFVKDMEIALDECRAMNIALPGLALVHQMYRGLMAQGGGKHGTQALIKVLENLNDFKINK